MALHSGRDHARQNPVDRSRSSPLVEAVVSNLPRGVAPDEQSFVLTRPDRSGTDLMIVNDFR